MMVGGSEDVACEGGAANVEGRMLMTILCLYASPSGGEIVVNLCGFLGSSRGKKPLMAIILRCRCNSEPSKYSMMLGVSMLSY